MIDYEESDYFITDSSELFQIESWIEPEDIKVKSLWEWSEPDETPLRIAICGAGGTGKRALANAMGKKLDLPVVEGIMRNIRSYGFRLNKTSSLEDQFAGFLAYLWSGMEYDEFVSAGSLIDVLAYLKYIVDISGDKKSKLLLRAMANCVNTIVTSHYSVFIYLPLMTKPRADGVRSVDMKFQSKIDKNIKYYLNAFDLDYFPITGSQKHKYTTAIDYLTEFGLLVDRGL